MDDPLALVFFLCSFPGCQIEDDVLAHAPYLLDARAFQCAGDFCGRRFQRLRLAADPDGIDAVAGHSLVQPVGDRFDFW